MAKSRNKLLAIRGNPLFRQRQEKPLKGKGAYRREKTRLQNAEKAPDGAFSFA